MMLVYYNDSMITLELSDTDLRATFRRAQSAFIPGSRCIVDNVDELCGDVYRKAGIDLRALRMEHELFQVAPPRELSANPLDWCKSPATAGLPPSAQSVTRSALQLDDDK